MDARLAPGHDAEYVTARVASTQRVDAGLCDLLVLVGLHAGYADRADTFALMDDWHPPWNITPGVGNVTKPGRSLTRSSKNLLGRLVSAEVCALPIATSARSRRCRRVAPAATPRRCHRRWRWRRSTCSSALRPCRRPSSCGVVGVRAGLLRMTFPRVVKDGWGQGHGYCLGPSIGFVAPGSAGGWEPAAPRRRSARRRPGRTRAAGSAFC